MTSDPTHSDVRPDNGDDYLAGLLRAAGRREEPPADDYRSALEVATLAWQRKVRRVRTQRAAIWAFAACILVAVGAAVLVHRTRPELVLPVAQLERGIGTVELRESEADPWRRVQPSADALRSGTVLRTSAESGAGLVLAGGHSVRLDSHTEIELESAIRIRLHGGRVYVDSGAGEASGIEIATPLGTARDVGTQFEVRYVGDAYRLRVREGRVRIARAGRDLESAAGEEVSLDASGIMRRSRISANDPGWRWTESLAPTPDFDGQPVAALLAWVGRETGRSVHFASPEIELQARNTILHGELGGLAPLEALEVMLATTDLSYAILENGTILVGVRPEPPIRSGS